MKKRRCDSARECSSSQRLQGYREILAAELESQLSPFEGHSFDDLESNQRAVRKIQQLLHRLGKRVRCGKSGCGEPAILKCIGGPRREKGAFQFRHNQAASAVTHLGKPTLPKLEFVAAPPDPRVHDEG